MSVEQKELNLNHLLSEQEKDIFKDNLFKVVSQTGFDIELKRAIKEHPSSTEWQVSILNDIYHDNTETIIKAYSTEYANKKSKKSQLSI